MVDRLGHALVSWLVPANLWAASLLACALLLDRLLARRVRASLRLAFYAPVALRVMVPPSWSVPLPHLPRVATLMPLETLSAAASSAPVSPASVSWLAALALVYLAVALMLGLFTFSRRRRLARALVSARTPVAPPSPCPVVAHPELGPMVVGFLEPRIVLPESMLAGESPEALACVLRHEAAHVRRRDPWLSVAIDATLVVCWPVVPLWLAAARVRQLMELACDEAALDGADEFERRRYGHVLLDLAEGGSLGLAGAGALHFGSTLRARVEAIALERPWPRALQAGFVAVAVAGFAACSSAGPGTVPQPADRHGVAPASSVDEYGYKFEDDRFDPGSPAERGLKGTPGSEEKEWLHGRLPPEVIQNVVRQSFGRFRTCYENAAAKNKTLAGTVTVTYVINPDGTTRDATGAGSTLPDADTVQCVVHGFGLLSYPPPEGGYVTVVYPIAFSPDD